jgi:hypothetical protein
MRSLLSTLFSILCFFNFVFVQESIVWEAHWEIAKNSISSWNVDSFGNLLVAEKDKIKKLDSTGNLIFVQSNKYFGQISYIDTRNPMKILLFSEQQQIISYLDNTLTKQQNTIELSEFDLSFVTLVSTSNQPDKFWIYDQDNSKIKLLSGNKQQNQRIDNVSGLIGCYDIIQIYENETNLYIIDKKKGIYQFDIYGTLLYHWENKNITWTLIEKEYLYILKDNKLEIMNLNTSQTREIELPINKINQFQKQKNYFYFSTEGKIQKFKLVIKN